MKPIDLFHIGPQKTATTWVYECFKYHPEIACPPHDHIHYYDMFYAKGREWYSHFFEEAKPGQKLFDPTYTYIRSTWAPRRIARDNPDARIIVNLRHPIERAFSHYWHEKKKRKHSFQFEEVLTNYDLFATWMEPGFYAEHIERYLEYFPRDHLLCVLLDELEGQPREWLVRMFEFANVSPTVIPPAVDEKINLAGARWPAIRVVADRVMRVLKAETGVTPGGVWRMAGKTKRGSRRRAKRNDEYSRGISPELYARLMEICEPEIERLERLLSMNLGRWKG